MIGRDLGAGVLDRAIWRQVEYDQVVEGILRDFQGRNRHIDSGRKWGKAGNACNIRGIRYLVHGPRHGGI